MNYECRKSSGVTDSINNEVSQFQVLLLFMLAHWFGLLGQLMGLSPLFKPVPPVRLLPQVCFHPLLETPDDTSLKQTSWIFLVCIVRTGLCGEPESDTVLSALQESLHQLIQGQSPVSLRAARWRFL